MDFTVCEGYKTTTARNILLLTLIIDDVRFQNTAALWDIYYHIFLEKKSHELLKLQAKKLRFLSTTMDDWNKSKYGSHLKFCDAATLTDTRRM